MRKFIVFAVSLMMILTSLSLPVFAEEFTAPSPSFVGNLVFPDDGNDWIPPKSMMAGGLLDLTFTIDLSALSPTDTTEYYGGEAYVAVSGSGFSNNGYLADKYIGTVNSNSTQFGVTIKAESSVPTGRYPVNVVVTYNKGSQSITMTRTLNIDVTGIPQEDDPVTPDPLKSNAYLNITSAPDGAVRSGDTFEIGYHSYFYGLNLVSGKISVSGTGFTLAGAYAEEDVSSNGYGTLTVLADSSMESGRQQLTVTVTYTDVDGEKYTASQVLNIDIANSDEEIDETGDNANFKLTAASIPEKKGRSNLSTELTITLENTTTYPAGGVKVRLTSLGDVLLNTYTDTIDIGDVEGKKVISAKFPIKFAEYPSAQTMLTAVVEYTDSVGAAQTQEFHIYLQASEKKKEEEAPESAALTPKLIVSGYTVDPESILSGEQFTLKFTLTNTSNEKDLRNMTVKVTPSAYSSTGSGTNTSSGPVFTFTDGTSSYYTDLLEKGASKEYEIRLNVSASAGAGIYPIEIEYDFEYAVGNGYMAKSDSMSINLPVEQPIKFDLMDWYPPEECGPDGTTISFQYFNKSRTPMSALAIAVEGDFTMEKQYVGSLAASSYDYFSGTIVPVDPSAVGETKTATLVFTFEDAAGKEQEIRESFDVKITEASADTGMDGMGGMGDIMMGGEVLNPDMMMPGDSGMIGEDGMPVDGENAENGGIPFWGKIAIGGGALIVVIVVIVVVVKKVKAKRELEDDDEE